MAGKREARVKRKERAFQIALGLIVPEYDTKDFGTIIQYPAKVIAEEMGVSLSMARTLLRDLKDEGRFEDIPPHAGTVRFWRIKKPSSDGASAENGQQLDLSEPNLPQMLNQFLQRVAEEVEALQQKVDELTQQLSAEKEHSTELEGMLVEKNGELADKDAEIAKLLSISIPDVLAKLVEGD